MESWDLIIYFLFIGVLLFVGKIIKTKVPVINRIVLPTALLAGILGLLFSNVLLGSLIPGGTYTIDVDFMTDIVYHCLALGFIALTLKREKKEKTKKIWSTGMIITSTYALQGFIGILIVLIFFADKFVGGGMLLALGFGQGPGLAMNFGDMWTEMLEGYGAALGLSYAFLGFVFGGTVGVLLINVISRKRKINKTKRYYDDSIERHNIEVDTVKEINVMDGLTVQVVIIFLIYFLVWGTLYILSGVLTTTEGGTIGDTVFGLLKGFNFIIGIFYALLCKVIIEKLEKKGKNLSFMTNDYVLSNLSSLFFNVMICGAVLAITIEFISSYGLLLIVVSAVGGILSMLYVRYMTRRVYTEFQDEYFVGLFGMLTGTASTGMALLKGLDRKLESPVAEELVLGSGTAITMALPLFVFLLLPSLGHGQTYETLLEYIALFGCLLYCVTMVVILLFRSRKTNDQKLA